MMRQLRWLLAVDSNYIITLNEAIARILAAESGEDFSVSDDLDPNIGLATIDLTNFRCQAKKCEFDQILQKGNGHSKTFGIIGMNPIGQALAQQLRSGFGWEILYYDWQPVPDIEAAYDARFVTVDRLLQQADLLCVVLPLTGTLARLIRQHYLAPKPAQAICIAWRRSLPIEQAAAHLGRYYSDCVHLDDLASIVGLNKFRLARLFSATFGITPHHFQLLLRVFYARSMLIRGVEIREIAYRLGFSDQSHFGRCFRSITSMTPGQYQKVVLDDQGAAGLFNELALEDNVESA